MKLRTKELFHWAVERHKIYGRKQAGLSAPWTKDEILQHYRFCNVYRELDTVTIWVREHWREPNAGNEDLWFAMYVARVFNKPATLEVVGFPLPWTAAKRGKMEKAIRALQAEDTAVFNNAYMVSTHGQKMDKVTFYLKFFDTLWGRRSYIRPRADDTLQTFYERLTEMNGVASFMAGQVIADTKYAGVLRKAEDWWTFAASGPGSRRGLNWVCGRDYKKGWREEDWVAALGVLKIKVDAFLLKQNMPPVHGQDLNNMLCETFKLVKVQQGWGRPKSRYNGAGL